MIKDETPNVTVTNNNRLPEDIDSSKKCCKGMHKYKDTPIIKRKILILVSIAKIEVSSIRK